jgi:hypothetical protein
VRLVVAEAGPLAVLVEVAELAVLELVMELVALGRLIQDLAVVVPAQTISLLLLVPALVVQEQQE